MDFMLQGEFNVKLEINDVIKEDKGSYKLQARNEKGEATSQTVEVTELPPEEKPKGEKPKISKLTNIVRIKYRCRKNIGILEGDQIGY